MVLTSRDGLLLALALGAAGCSSKDETPKKTGPDITPVLSGPEIKYVPDGCDYAVTSPTVDQGLVDGPTLAVEAPDNVDLGIAGDAATTFVVNWRSEQDATASVLLFGTDEAAVTSADAASGSVKSQKDWRPILPCGLNSSLRRSMVTPRRWLIWIYRDRRLPSADDQLKTSTTGATSRSPESGSPYLFATG